MPASICKVFASVTLSQKQISKLLLALIQHSPQFDPTRPWQVKSLLKGRVPFVYYLHPQIMRMIPFTLCWPDESNYSPKGPQPYILQDLVKPRSTSPSESSSHLSAPFPGAHCPIFFLLYKVRFLSPNVLL